MKLNRDLRDPRAIHAKGILFAAVGFLAAALILVESPRWKTLALLTVAVWAFCRFYYYLFYVLERYLGREQRFAGVFAALRFLATSAGSRRTRVAQEPDRKR